VSVLPLFREFTQWVKTEQRAHLPAQTVSRLYRAHARLRVAKRYDGIRLIGLSTTLVAGYSAGVRLLLSYSAAESMGSAIGRHIANWTIRHPEIVAPLRRISKELKDWPDGLNKNVKTQLAEFVLERHDNIRVPATALRHLMAHGHFAPAGKISLGKAEIAAVETLCDDLVAETEQRFAAWFNGVSGGERP
jgi:hypothetical protein